MRPSRTPGELVSKVKESGVGDLVHRPGQWAGSWAVVLLASLPSAIVIPGAARSQQTAKVTGALKINQAELKAVKNAKVNEKGLHSGIASIANLVLIAAGCIGVIMAAGGIAKLYSHYKKGDVASGSTIGRWAMGGIGGFMSIVAVVVALTPAAITEGIL